MEIRLTRTTMVVMMRQFTECQTEGRYCRSQYVSQFYKSDRIAPAYRDDRHEPRGTREGATFGGDKRAPTSRREGMESC